MTSQTDSNSRDLSQDNRCNIDDRISTLIDHASLLPTNNRFFKAAQACRQVDGEAALRIAQYWRETTKAFMFTTIAGIGVLAQEAAQHPSPPRHLLDVIQTAFRVISDDLNNVLPVFKAVAPTGAAGIHYLWWENAILGAMKERLNLDPSSPLPPLPGNVRVLLENMHRLSVSPLGAAVQLRVVEAIALEICVAFKQVFTRVVVDRVKVFTTTSQLAWMNSHIQAEVTHSQEVSDHNTGMTSIADTDDKREVMLGLVAEYVTNWNAALEDFAAALE